LTVVQPAWPNPLGFAVNAALLSIKTEAIVPKLVKAMPLPTEIPELPRTPSSLRAAARELLPSSRLRTDAFTADVLSGTSIEVE